MRGRCRLGQRTRIGTSPRSRSMRTTPFPGAPPTPPVETFYMLLETGDRILLETGDILLTESAP